MTKFNRRRDKELGFRVCLFTLFFFLELNFFRPGFVELKQNQSIREIKRKPD